MNATISILFTDVKGCLFCYIHLPHKVLKRKSLSGISIVKKDNSCITFHTQCKSEGKYEDIPQYLPTYQW